MPLGYELPLSMAWEAECEQLQFFSLYCVFIQVLSARHDLQWVCNGPKILEAFKSSLLASYLQGKTKSSERALSTRHCELHCSLGPDPLQPAEQRD